MHDLKNLAAQLSLLVANAAQHKHNPEFVDDAISTIANSTTRMQRLVDQLQGREIKSVMRRTSLAEVAGEACRRCAVRTPVPVCEPVSDDACVEADPERLGMMVEHLIRNAQEATPADGTVRVSLSVSRDLRLDSTGASGIHAVTPEQLRAAAVQLEAGAYGAPVAGSSGDYACLSVEDTGAGMTPEFVKERLFRPFDTTKGSKGMGIGAYQVREYVRSIGGRVRVESAPGQGTRFTLWLPLQPAAEAAPQA
jgi:signal transduction histidine kinase